MSVKPSARTRPLSPFMLGPYYRLQLTSVLSFAHRITGVGLSLGAVLLAVWLLSALGGPASYDRCLRWLHAPIGQVLLLAWSWSLFYHLCNGIRHLVWDSGRGFAMRAVYLGGWLVVAASLLLTAGFWAVGLA
jgi:succinate dehydrogenase subunit C (EC 1.3.5.1)